MSSSLGTLTLDLLVRTGGFVEGWDKATRETKKRSKQLRKELTELGDAITNYGKIAVGAAAAATAALIAHTVSASKEISKLSQLSNATTTEFQKYVAGAKQVGVEQEKLGDIFKDVNDKVGDFLQTGGGPLADFFENIAPKIDVTAEQFRNLSGPQALQLYVSSLEKANLSQNQMVFFMEAIASDASALLPLLRNGGEGFKVFGDEAERAGAILDDRVIPATDKIRAAMTLAENASVGFKNQIAMGILPTVADLGVAFSDFSADSLVAAGTVDILNGSMKFLAASAVGTVAAIDLTRKSLAAMAASFSTIDFDVVDFLNPVTFVMKIAKSQEQIKSAFDVGLEDLKLTADEYATVLNSIWSAGEGDESNERINQLAEQFKMLREVSFGGSGEDVNAKLQDDMEARLEVLREASMSELEILTEKRNAEEALLLEQLSANKLANDEFMALDLASWEEYEQAKTDLSKAEAMQRKQLWQSSLGIISTLMNSESKKMFRVGQAAAIANTIISTHAAAMKAMEQLGAWGWPVAAAIGVAGLANVQAIRSTKFGAGSAGMTNTQAVNATATPVVPPGEQSEGIFGEDLRQQAQRSVSIYISGPVDRQFLKDALLPALSEEINENDVTFINAESAQARQLMGAS